MVFEPTGWFIGWICGKLADKALKRLASNNDLRTKLDAAVEDWANSLPKDKYVNPVALFPDVGSLTEKDRPKYYALQQKLTNKKLPLEKDWHEVFMESWLYVRKNISEPQPFFLLTEQQAGEKLEELAKKIYGVCKQDDATFKSQVIEDLKEIKERIKTYKPRKAIRVNNIPYASIGDLFKGRDEILGRLKKELGESKATAITQGIQGLGGIGKTRLAIEFGWWALQNKKYRCVFFVGSETPERINASLASLAGEKILGLAGQKEDEQISSVMRWLKENDGWLMIFDNADSEDVATQVEDLLPQLSSGRVIITSRYTRWSGAVSPQTLGLLEPDKAKEFLLQRTKGRRIETDKDEQVAGQLAKEVGFLPLALEQIGAYIAHNKCSLAEYLNQWQSEREQVLQWYNKRQMQYDVSVAVTWQRTFEQLNPSAIALLRISSFLAPEMILIDMFEKSAGILDESVKLLCKEMEIKAPKFNLKESLSDLSAYSMLTREEKGFTIHRIVQEVLRSRIPHEHKRAWIEMALRIVNDYAPTDSFDVRTWPILDVLRPHAEIIAETADKEKITEPTARLMSVLGTYLHYKGLYDKSERWKRRALTIDEQSLGKDHPDVARDLNNLAQLYKATNRLKEAEPLMKRALAIDEASFGKDHPDVAIDLNNLALLYQDTNRLKEAEPLMKRALAIGEASLGKDHPKVAIRLNNLAQLYKATNRLKEAEPLMKRALAIDEASFGKDHPDVAIDLNNLAQLYQDTNRVSEAEPLMQRVVKIFEKSLGENHPNVAAALNNLAQLYKATNRLKEAEPLYKRVVDIFEKSLGPEHPNIATALNNLAALYKATDRLKEAEPLMRRALKIFEDSLGPDHPSTIIVRNNLEALKK
jgi:tetratricopeptide (TPR) repeat protein